jgi:hypothetical protein
MKKIVHLLSKIDAMREKMISHHEDMRTDMRTWRKEMKADLEATEAYPERTESRIETGQEPLEAEIKTCLVYMEANPEERKRDCSGAAGSPERGRSLNCQSTEEAVREPAFGCRLPPEAVETDPRR